MTLDPLGAVVALCSCLALIAFASWVRARRPLRLADRIAPFVGAAATVPAGVPADRSLALPGPRLLSPTPISARRHLPDPSVALWTTVGGVVGLALAALLTADQPRPAAWVALAVTGAVSGRWFHRARGRARLARERREIDQQVPVLADLLALAVSAGATPMAALGRAAAVLPGVLSRRLQECSGRMRTGTPLGDALDILAAEAQVPSLTRLVDAIAQAHARGTPLTEVVRAQAADARAEERRRLLETAGRKDVAMLVPIVFLVLPTVIVIAIFPGLSALEVVVP